MKLELRKRDRRALILMGMALIVYFSFTAMILPFYDDLALATDTALERENQLRRYRRAVLQKANYAEVLVEARKRVEEGEALLIRGDNPSLASAELQMIIEEIAEITGIELGQRNISPATRKDDFFNEITMTFGFESTPGQVVALLERLRNSEKLVTVRSIQIAPLRIVHEVSEDMELLKDLRVNLTVGAILASAPSGDNSEG